MKKLFSQKDLDSIDTKGSPQVRFDIRDDVVADYAENYQNKVKMPEVVLFEVEPRHYLIADGWHRFHALKAQEPDKKRVWAFDVRKGSYEDCLKFALQANVTHGLRRTNADKHSGAVAAVKAFVGLSDVQIADIAAVGGSLVGQVRKELAKSGVVPLINTRKGKDGKTFTLTNRKADAPNELKNASKTKEVPSATAVPDISSTIHPSKDSGELRCKTGVVIPEDIKLLWARRNEVLEMLQAISDVKVYVAKAVKAEDVLYAEMDNHFEVMIGNVYQTLKQALPYAVCTACNGKRPEKCVLCKGRGFISQFLFESPAITEKTRKLREQLAREEGVKV